MKEAYDWMIKIIDSCYTGFHYDAASKLLECFKDRYGDNGYYDQLRARLKTKAPQTPVLSS